MGYYDFPHTRTYDSDLGFLIKRYKELNKDYDTLVKIYEMVQNDIENITIEQLQKWLDDGTIENILLKSSKVIITVDTTVDMLNEIFINGSIIKTIGYNNVQDIKGALFYVNDYPLNNKFYFKKNNQYFSIINDEISTNQCGIFPNNDNTDELNTFLSYDYFKHYIDSGTYMVNGKNDNDYHYWGKTGVYIPKNRTVIFKENAILKLIPCNTFSSSIIQLQQSDNVKIVNAYLIGDRDEHALSSANVTDELGLGILIRNSKNIEIDNAKIYNCHGDGIYIGSAYEINESLVGQCKNIYIHDSYLERCYRNGMSICYCDGVEIENCNFNYIQGTAPQTCIDIESESYDVTKYLDNRNINVKNCYSKQTKGFIEIYDSFNCNIENCSCEENAGYIYEHLVKYSNTKTLKNRIADCYAQTISIVSNQSVIENCHMGHCGLGHNADNNTSVLIIKDSVIEHVLSCYKAKICKIINCELKGNYQYQPTITNTQGSELYIYNSRILDAILYNITIRNGLGKLIVNNSYIEGNMYVTSCDVFIDNCEFVTNGKNSITTNSNSNILCVTNSKAKNVDNSINFLNSASSKIYVQNNIMLNEITNFISASNSQQNKVCVINNNILNGSNLNLLENRENDSKCINF